MTARTYPPRRKRRASSAIGLYSAFSLSSALVYCAQLVGASLSRGNGPREETANAMNSEFFRVSAGR